MKVALFLPGLLGGGAERVMLNLAAGFVHRGLDVHMVLGKPEGPLLSQAPPQVRIVDLGVTRMHRALPGLVRYLRTERPPALLAALDQSNVVSLWAKAIARVPTRVVVSVHSDTNQVVLRLALCAIASFGHGPARSTPGPRQWSRCPMEWQKTSCSAPESRGRRCG